MGNNLIKTVLIRCPSCFQKNETELKPVHSEHVCTSCGLTFYIGWILIANTDQQSLTETIEVAHAAVEERNFKLSKLSSQPS